ncbi:hypothetical protein CANCADRAFT_308 [Tortispora caseinolytica NRRL Y-17796]|uniref:Small nuclear ribonucleoprotein Sm D3 n=1 Tax=Tortispora caseinolytica NRRL Y-17796 TaxID=767744 RepID=A0A1E4TIZ1_9ASCO|nr:hypothetical protein CANCADRAFT_308 [Tortispora caseinolytica NRRL Y-17796]
MSVGVPVTLLNEAEGHIISVELVSGQILRGKLLEVEDNMNIQLEDITSTARNGKVSHMEKVYVRGSNIRFFSIPEILRHAPMLTNKTKRDQGLGMVRGKVTVQRSQGDRVAR